MKKKWIAVLCVLTGVLAAGEARAQEMRTGPGTVEVTLAPVGGTFFREGGETPEPGFGSYDLGAGLTFNVNRYFGIEAEVGGALGVSQDLLIGGDTSSLRPPHMLSYGGSLVFSIPNQSAFVPYVAGGVGGLTVFERASLDVNQTETFLTGNIGGGLKWYGGRWGLRGDYRLIPVRSKDGAPEFFGRETRYGHRVYGGIIVNLR
jgi:hypothetical protein